jgi:long-chain acyl-CoA synthetase
LEEIDEKKCDSIENPRAEIEVNLAQLLVRASKIWPDSRAISYGEEFHATFDQFAERAARIGGSLLRDYSLKRGDRVGVIMKNRPEYLEALYGIWFAGLVAVPVNAKLHPRECSYILRDSGASVCFISAELEDSIVDPVRRIIIPGPSWLQLQESERIQPVVVAEDDVAWLFYTSGTTGRPKGAMLTHGNLRQATLSFFVDVEKLDTTDSVVHAAPMSHGSGLYNFAALHGGANQVVPRSGQFEPHEIYDLIQYYPGTFFFAAPTMVKRLVEAPDASRNDTSNLKNIIYGGGPMYLADLKAAMELFGNKLGQIYGQGESPMTITTLSKAMHSGASDERLSSVGVAQSVVELKVVGEQGEELPAGEVGEICVRGKVVMKAYWNNPDATAAALRQGWLYTGDIGVFDSDGFLTLKDRVKDVIISGGSNIYPREVEEILLMHPDILEASVIGNPHPDWGEEVIAFIVSRGGANVTEKEMDQLCLDNIARFKRPKRYSFLDSLPKNNYGKVLKTALRDRLAASLNTED